MGMTTRTITFFLARPTATPIIHPHHPATTPATQPRIANRTAQHAPAFKSPRKRSQPPQRSRLLGPFVRNPLPIRRPHTLRYGRVPRTFAVPTPYP